MFNLLDSPLFSYKFPPFADEKNEAHRGEVNGPI